MIGAKPITEAADGRRLRVAIVVGERAVVGRRATVRTPGRGSSEYVGMSSETTGEKPVRRKSKVSWGRLIRPGLVGPKPRPKGVGDGQSVNIPIPHA